MASHSPQRPRRQPTQQGPLLNHQQREMSPSPTLRDQRPRALKTQSMPLVPPVAAFAQAPTQNQPQASPTIQGNAPRRSSPLGQVTRLLPTPPHNNPPNFQEDRRPSSPPASTQTNVNPHYSRPAPRAPIAAYPNKFPDMGDHWQMTDELLADIERADQQQAQYQSQVQSYPSAPRTDSPLGRGPNVERIRATAERSSPTTQHRGREQVARESPKNRDRQPASPIISSFGTLQSSTPERRMSPQLQSEAHPASYHAQYTTREPPVLRRAPNSDPQRLNPSIASQTPPLQVMPTRNPDRSLPVQEEDEVTSKNGSSAHANWQATDQVDERPFHSSSPTPSSDLNPEGTTQRFDTNSQTVHREEEKHDEEHEHAQYAERDSTEESGGYTPRSPTAQLPDDTREPYYPGQIRVPAPIPARKGRNGSGDQIMRGLEATLLEKQQQQQGQQAPSSSSSAPQQAQPSERPPKYVEQRQPTHGQNDSHQYPQYPSQQDYPYNHEPNNGRYIPPQVYPDDFHSYGEESTSAYISAYLHSSRPDAPVPPTPHSQTAAPSPSPLLAANMPSYRGPARAAGSPYPFPFNHVRRNRPQTQTQRLLQNGLDPATIQEQVARQWQIFAQNNQGNITDSTLSPTSTPFQGDLFDHWAHLHTNKMMRGMLDTASMHSSPSHQPIPLPMYDFGPRKKDRGPHAKRQAYTRKPPPRVESTQPRETSPELSSSGEETAGEERLNPTPDVLPFPPREPTQVPLPSDTADGEDDGEWVDEEDEDDYEDLIELEYHPAFVKNVSKRRRKWEVGWENLIQAFQALDRQTDATMVLLASPSHTTKLHLLRSRSIRRQPALESSTNMKELRSNFARMASQRRTTRPVKASLVDRLQAAASSTSGGDGSDGSSSQESLRRALDAALGSLSAMGEVYEQREARVLEELQRSREDYERMELLLKQVLGDKNPLKSSANRAPS